MPTIAPTPPTASSLPKILLVDDESSTPNAITGALIRRADCTYCRDPYEALRQQEQVSFDAAYIDMNMPGMNGLALIVELRKRDPTLACILITGAASVDRIPEIVNAQPFRFLAKPAALATIREVAEAAVARTRADRQRLSKEQRLAELDKLEGLLEQSRLERGLLESKLHDMGHPLFALIRYTEEFEQNRGDVSSDTAAARQIRRQLEALQAIAGSIRDLTKFGTEKTSSLEATLDTTRAIMRAFQKELPKRPELVVAPPPAGVMLRVPHGEAIRVLNNIAVNALDACASQVNTGGVSIFAEVGKGILVEDARSHGLIVPEGILDLDPQQNYAIIVFADTGGGIKSDLIPKLFSEGFTTKPTGQGKGLATVKRVLIEHHGLVAVDTQYGRGTTFYVYFPCSAAAP